MQVQRYPTIFEARAAERLAILAEKPLRNKPFGRPKNPPRWAESDEEIA